jgi:hypothetical protein
MSLHVEHLVAAQVRAQQQQAVAAKHISDQCYTPLHSKKIEIITFLHCFSPSFLKGPCDA